MFPITDAARADDIRLRRRRALALLAGIVVLGIIVVQAATRPEANNETALGPAAPVLAGSRVVEASATSRSAAGGALAIKLPCANSITVTPKPGLSRRVLVSATGDVGNDRVRLVGGGTITLADECRDGSPDVTVSAPASMPLTIVQTGGTDLRLGAFTGPVTLTQTGSGDMAVEGAGELKVSMTGGGDLAVDHLRGDLRVNQMGGGDIHIASIQAANVALNMTGGGDVAIAAGHITRLRAMLRGGGDLKVDAVVGDATVSADGDTSVSLPRLTGHLTQDGAAGTGQP